MLFLFHLFILIVFQCLRLFKYLILFSPFLSSPFTLLHLLLFSLFCARGAYKAVAVIGDNAFLPVFVQVVALYGYARKVHKLGTGYLA